VEPAFKKGRGPVRQGVRTGPLPIVRGSQVDFKGYTRRIVSVTLAPFTIGAIFRPERFTNCGGFGGFNRFCELGLDDKSDA